MSFNPDQPINDVADDVLGTAQFVECLVGPLLEMPSDASLVVGLYGEWGRGKSSALNLLAGAINDATTANDITRRGQGAVLVRFTPWLYSDVETLLIAFFDTLAASVDDFPMGADVKRRRLRQTLKGIGAFMTSATGVTAALTSASRVAGLVTAGSALTAGMTVGIAKLLDRNEASFQEKKDQAAQALLQLGTGSRPRRLVVLIDDLDRVATGEDALAVLKLVRLVADFPNVSYVIAMDRARVEQLLELKLPNGGGRAFLDKIIQVPITLPPVSQEQLSKAAVNACHEMAARAGLKADELEVEWDGWAILRSRLFEPRLTPMLQTMRDVARLTNAFAFAVGAHPGLEVNAADMLLVCALQVFYPEVYARLAAEKLFLLNLTDPFESLAWRRDSESEVTEARRRRLREIACTLQDLDEAARGGEAQSGFPRQQTTIVLDVLTYLFPHALVGRAQDRELADARLAKRIWTADHFDQYFRLAPSAGHVSHREADAIFGALTTAGVEAGDPARDSALAALVALASGPRSTSLVQQLSDRLKSASPAHLRKFASSMGDLAALRSDSAWLLALALSKVAASELVQPSAPRNPPEAGDAACASDLIINVVGHVGAYWAAEFCYDMLQGDLFDEPERTRIALAGLVRSHEWLDAEHDLFRESSREKARDSIWTLYYLAAWAGKLDRSGSYAPLVVRLSNALVAKPERLSDILSLFAGWGERPTFAHSEPAKVIASLTHLMGASDPIIGRAREMLASEEGPRGTWPELIGEFVALVDRTA